MVPPGPEEGKMLSEALNTVKIQVQQMKRHLVRQQCIQLQRPCFLFLYCVEVSGLIMPGVST